MRIALVNQWYPPDYGGVGVYNGAMASAYVGLGHQVTVITARSNTDQPPLSVQNGVRICRVDRWVEPYRARRLPLVGRHVRSLRHLDYSRRVCALLHRVAKLEGLDVVEFAEINAEGFLAALAGNRVPTVVRCHTPHVLLRRTTPPGDRKWDTTLIEQAEQSVTRRATALTAPSRDLSRLVEQEMGLRPGRVVVIPNAIDLEEFSPTSEETQLHDQQPVTILHVGRLEREKGVFVLAEALVKLAAQQGQVGINRVPRWRVIFAGGDRSDAAGVSNRLRLEQFFAAHGISGRVELRGFVGQDELVSLYRSADLCVVPSILYESFSYTCLQAMACGRPLVATTMGGIPEVVVDGLTGLLVPPGDAISLGCALGRLVDDVGLRRRLGQAGRARAEQLYGHYTVARQNLTLYTAAIEHRGRPVR